MTRIGYTDLADLVTAAFSKAGARPADARIAADAIVYAEASGLVSHGLVRVESLVGQLRSGKINNAAVVTIREANDSVRLVDADHGLGYVAAARATEAVRVGLRSNPLMLATVSRSHHFGVAGYYTEQLALAGYVALAVSGTVAAIAPVGGRTGLLGNGPLSMAAPRADAPPVVIDIAPAVAARGNILAAARRGDQIPAGWALDSDGAPTTDPHAALDGTLIAAGGYKGVLMAMMMDLLIATTTTSQLPGAASSVFTSDGPPPELGQLILGLDPAALGVSNVAATCERYVDSLVSDGTQMRVPGVRRQSARDRAVRDGIDVDSALLSGLNKP